jgi:membrane protease YdiL (CAAX protease family)
VNNRATRKVNTVGRIVVAVLLGFLVLAVGGAVITLLEITPESPTTAPWLGPFAMHTTMLVVSFLLVIALSRGRIADYGFTWTPITGLSSTILWSLGVGTAGAVLQATLCPLDMPVAQQFTFSQVVVFIWIYASICEEVLTRGLIQGYLAPLKGRGLHALGLRVSLPVIVGALFFALMHLPAIVTAGGVPSQLVFLVVAAFLGLMAGHYREKTGSLLPAVLVHMLFNVSASVVDALSEALG